MSACAVISPDGHLAWYPLTETADVQAIVSGEYAPGALDRAFVTGPLRVMASDVALLAPEHCLPNPLAQWMIAELSGSRIGQPWRGYVALVRYEQDRATGEWLLPGEMSAEWAERITAAVRQRREAAAQIRLWGAEDECKRMAQLLIDAPGFEVVSVSDPYADRGASVLARVFLEARLDAPTVRVTSTTPLATALTGRSRPQMPGEAPGTLRGQPS